MIFKSLPQPARYFPFEKGIYEVAPGLKNFGIDLGNGEVDQKVFQIDSEYLRYLENKKECRKERIEKYYLSHDFTAQSQIFEFLMQRLIFEHSDIFSIEEENNKRILFNQITKEKLFFDNQFNLQDVSKNKYVDFFDALCSQIQEDVAVIQRNSKTFEDYLSAIHLCSAGHWSPQDKIGKNFFEIHKPVAHIEKINANAKNFVESMIHKGPFVRFAWGFSTDTRLNHHPEAPIGSKAEDWIGRSFKDSNSDRLFVRVERQITWGFPQSEAALFFIRVHYLSGEEILKDEVRKIQLRKALESMSPQALIYKGLKDSLPALLKYLA